MLSHKVISQCLQSVGQSGPMPMQCEFLPYGCLATMKIPSPALPLRIGGVRIKRPARRRNWRSLVSAAPRLSQWRTARSEIPCAFATCFASILVRTRLPATDNDRHDWRACLMGFLPRGPNLRCCRSGCCLYAGALLRRELSETDASPGEVPRDGAKDLLEHPLDRFLPHGNGPPPLACGAPIVAALVTPCHARSLLTKCCTSGLLSFNQASTVALLDRLGINVFTRSNRPKCFPHR